MSNIMESPLKHDEDAALVKLCKQGDTDAFEILVRKHERRLFNIAYRIAGDYDDACEVVQDAFVSAYRNIKGFRGSARFSTWLTAIAINFSKNRLKRVRARLAHEQPDMSSPIRLEDGEMIVDPPSRDPSALEQLEKQDVRRAVQDCIGRLEHEFREALVLRDIQGFSYEEICDMLRVREGTVKSRLFRARESVRDCLKNAAVFP